MGMILLGIVYGAVTGNMQAVTDAAFASAKDAVTLCITMLGVMTLWTGVLEIGHRNDGTLGWRDGDSQRSRADQKMVRKIKAVYPFSFPGDSKRT
mgnify:CR=1 FL=1